MFQVDQFINNIYIALQNGHRQIAARLVAEAVRLGGYGYNYLHEEVGRFFKIVIEILLLHLAEKVL